MASTDPSPVPAPQPSSPGRAVVLGVLVGVALAATVFVLIAIPLYTLASFEPNGLDRPVIRTGLFRVALPVAAVAGVVGGAAVGRWLHRGGAWTASDPGDRYSNR